MTLEARSALGGFAGVAQIVAKLGAPEVPVELVNRADIGCLLCTAAVEPDPHRAKVAEITGVSPPVRPAPVFSSGLRQAIWMTPRSWLLLCPLSEEEELLWALADAFPDCAIHACRYSDHLCWLELSGPGAEALLCAGGFLSLDGRGPAPGSAKRGLLAGIAVVIHREEAARWLLGVERSRARYLVDWLTATARQQEAIRRRR